MEGGFWPGRVDLSIWCLRGRVRGPMPKRLIYKLAAGVTRGRGRPSNVSGVPITYYHTQGCVCNDGGCNDDV